MRELIVFLCCVSQASSGVCTPSFVREVVVLAVSSSWLQRRTLSPDVLFVESQRDDALLVAQRRATVAESALKHRPTSADIDVDGVRGSGPFSHKNSSVALIIMSSDVLLEEYEVR